MKTLVIHPYDPTTEFLSVIYSEHEDWNVIKSDIGVDRLKSEIKCHDRIIMLGHGNSLGLGVNSKYIIDKNFVPILKKKECVCIWCDADVFTEANGINGLCTGMIISDIDESYLFCVSSTIEEIEFSNKLFASAISKAIDCDNPLDVINSIYQGDSEVISFNSANIFYKKD